MDSSYKRVLFILACVALAAISTPPALAQPDDEEEARPAIPVPKEHLRQAQQILDAAKNVGPWERNYQIMEEATDNVFVRQGWESEPDQFARNVMREVGRVPPWEAQKRQEVFLNQIQLRYGLTHDQVRQADGDFQREGMALAIKHFKDVAPMVLEMVKTRASNEPFTPEQVQRWTGKLRPIMDEVSDSIERVTGKLEQTMTADQRRLIESDVKAFRRRQEDVKRMTERWAAGQWTPADWGLQNDPIHAGEVSRAARADAAKSALVEQAVAAKKPDEQAIVRSEDQWERYVKWFCSTYQCDDRQRTAAASILAGCEKEAISYRSAKRDTILEYERAMRRTEDPQRRKRLSTDLDRALQPIADIFERMKRRLYEEVLTTAQRVRNGPLPLEKAEAKDRE